MSYKTNIIFMSIEDSKTSDPYRITINLTDKINLKRKTNALYHKILLSNVLGKI